MSDRIKIKSGIEWNYCLEGEGHTLLFLHGWGVDQRIWRQQTKHFSDTYQVLSVDLPGHGESSWKKVPLKVMAEDLNGLLEYLQISNISLVGSSLGGLLGLKIYELAPQKIKRLVFVGSMPRFSKAADYPYGLDVEKIRKLDGQVQADYPDIVNVFFRSLFTKAERQTRRFRWLQRFRRTEGFPVKQALREYLEVLEHEDLRDVLKRVSVPTQFINGREDAICDSKTVDFLKSICPQARFEFFEGCGHFPFLSKPYEFNDMLEKFLQDAKNS
ncbi:MAG: alpha/beta fold hydrolase [Candidatus Omnitrophica bacterium]|nr:alpha/beta fold hydrolase [Candidatus Omnitrophota bacterium]